MAVAVWCGAMPGVQAQEKMAPQHPVVPAVTSPTLSQLNPNERQLMNIIHQGRAAEVSWQLGLRFTQDLGPSSPEQQLRLFREYSQDVLGLAIESCLYRPTAYSILPEQKNEVRQTLDEMRSTLDHWVDDLKAKLTFSIGRRGMGKIKSNGLEMIFPTTRGNFLVEARAGEGWKVTCTWSNVKHRPRRPPAPLAPPLLAPNRPR